MELHQTALLRRIVGTPTPSRWAQTLVLDEKVSPAGLVMAVVEVSVVSPEEDGAATVGKAILTHLETSLTKTVESVYQALEASLTTIPEYIPRPESSDADNPTISVVAGVLAGNVLFLGVIGHGRVMMRRSVDVATLLADGQRFASVEMASGNVQHKDRVVFGTPTFFSVVSADILDAAFHEGKLDDAIDAITPHVHKDEEGSGAAAIVVDIDAASPMTSEDPPFAPSDSREATDGQEQTAAESDEAREESLSMPTLSSTIGQPRSRWALFIGGGICAALLLAGWFFYSTKVGPQRVADQAQIQALLKTVQESEEFLELHPSRSRELVTMAKTAHAALPENIKRDKQVQEASKKLDALSEKLKAPFTVEKPDVYFSYSLIGDGVIADSIKGDEGEVVLFSRGKGAVYTVDLAQKQSSVVIGGEAGPKDASWVVLTNNRFYAVGKEGTITRFEKSATTTASMREGETWGTIQDVAGYGGNVYLLDTKEQAIWKYEPYVGGLGDPRYYLRGNSELPPDAVSLAIDGSVWVVSKTGEVRTYVQGFRQDFAPSDVPEAFMEVRGVFTDEDQKNLYILDSKAKRVVVMDKQGVYQAEYSSPVFAEAKAVVADEENSALYALTAESIYRFDLQ